jgi:hypothetical protein
MQVEVGGRDFHLIIAYFTAFVAKLSLLIKRNMLDPQ